MLLFFVEGEIFMDQEKIGRFIAERRKEKDMTQIDLANKLGITDRAISKWENGRGLPDISLLIPLCEVLDISINELLCGEKLEENAYSEKFDENIKTIDYSNKKIYKAKMIFLMILISVLTLFLILVAMFVVDINMMKNNKPVVFSTWGYQYVPPIDLKEDEINVAVIDYILQNGDSEPKHHDFEKTFASMKVYLLEEKEKNQHYNIYAWVLTKKYYLDNEQIKEDGGSSIPHKFVVKNIDGKFVVTDCETPRDGSYYSFDMKNIFPNSVLKDMEQVHLDGTIERLELEIEQQTKLYFHKP